MYNGMIYDAPLLYFNGSIYVARIRNSVHQNSYIFVVTLQEICCVKTKRMLL